MGNDLLEGDRDAFSIPSSGAIRSTPNAGAIRDRPTTTAMIGDRSLAGLAPGLDLFPSHETFPLNE